MLSRSNRMSGRQVESVIRKGRITHSPFFIVRFILDGGDGSTRLSAVVPVKVGKTSVTRHLVRRRIYEAVRPLSVEISSGTHTVIMAKQPALSTKPLEMRADLRAIFVKAGLLR